MVAAHRAHGLRGLREFESGVRGLRGRLDRLRRLGAEWPRRFSRSTLGFEGAEDQGNSNRPVSIQNLFGVHLITNCLVSLIWYLQHIHGSPFERKSQVEFVSFFDTLKLKWTLWLFAFTLRYSVLLGQYQRAPTFNLWYHLKLILEIIFFVVCSVVTKYLCKHY